MTRFWRCFMKVLLLTYFCPYVSKPLRGIFVTKTIEQHKRIGIDYTAIPIGYGKFAINSLEVSL